MSLHPTYTEKGSLLHTLYGENFPVNSAHHQGIAEPGEGLIVIQHAPDGVAEAIAQSPALKILVMNIMTQDGESDGYTGADHVRALLHHGAPGIIDVCIANNAVIGEAILAPYRQEGVEQLRLEREEIEAMGIQVEEYPMATGERYIRHDTYALASAIMEVYRRSRLTR